MPLALMSQKLRRTCHAVGLRAMLLQHASGRQQFVLSPTAPRVLRCCRRGAESRNII